MKAWLLVGFLWVCYLLNHADRQVVPVLFPTLQREFGLSSTQLGLMHAVFLWTYGLCSPLAGWVGDRFSKRKLATGSLAAWSGVTVLTGFAPSGLALLASRALLGFAECFYYPAAATLVGNAHPPATRSRAMAAIVTSQIAGVALGGTLTGHIAEHYHWRWAFFALGAIGLLHAVPLWLFLRTLPPAWNPDASPAGPSPLRGISQLLGRPSFLSVMGFIAVSNFSLFLVYSWLPTIVADRFRLGVKDAAIESSLYPQLGSLAGLLLGGYLADRFQRATPASRFYVVMAGFAFSAPAIYAISQADSLPAMRLATMAFGCFNGFINANQVACAFDIVPAHLRASTVGTFNFAGGFVSGMAPYLGGVSRDTFGLNGLLVFTAALLLAGSLLPWLAARGVSAGPPSLPNA
jgi:MFS transporter, Spinster family, sphingosine-1-phosphate transporter